MFIFYYAVLSEVSPPTALSPFAAAAITGGDPYKTTLQSWKYTLPAFLVPFVFVLDPAGIALLLKVPPNGVVAARRVDRVDRVPRHRRACGGRAEVAAARAARKWSGWIADGVRPAAHLSGASWPTGSGIAGIAMTAVAEVRRRQVAADRRVASRPCARSTKFSTDTANRTAIRPTRRFTGSACRSSCGARWRRCGLVAHGRVRRDCACRSRSMRGCRLSSRSECSSMSALMVIPADAARGTQRARGSPPSYSCLAWIGQFVGHVIEGKKPSVLRGREIPAGRAGVAAADSSTRLGIPY